MSTKPSEQDPAPRSGIDRRGFLRSSLLTGAAAVVGPSLLAACGKASSGGDAAGSAAVKLPTYVPFRGPTPQLPSSAEGIDAGFTRFPTELATAVRQKPGDGKPISVLGWTEVNPPPPVGSNAYWQQLNDRLGSDLKIQITADYPTTFNTVVAGGTIPELVWFTPNQGLTHVAELLQAKFTDLTPYLAGDSVKDYPNLANIQSYAWKTAVINGRIWGNAIPYGTFGQVYVGNKKSWAAVGGTTCSSPDEFLSKAKDITDAKRSKWALEPVYVNAVHMFREWYGAPNGWELKDGHLTNYIETDAYEAALEFGVKCFKAGVFYPDATLEDYYSKQPSGQVATTVKSFPNFMSSWTNYVRPNLDFDLDVIMPFGAEGATPSFDLGYGSVGFSAIRKGLSEQRVRTILKVVDYLSAPFGSSEWTFLNYGTEGTHHTRNAAGDPVLTSKGQSEVATLHTVLTFLANGPETIYTPGFPQATSYVHQVQTELMTMAKANPTTGFYSDTSTNKGAQLGTMINDHCTDVVSGRKPVSSLKDVVRQWKSQGGDRMRGEYEKAIAAAK